MASAGSQALRRLLVSRVPAAVTCGVRQDATNLAKLGRLNVTVVPRRHVSVYSKRSSTMSATAQKFGEKQTDGKLVTALPSAAHTIRLVFDTEQSYEMNYVWLRDNCQCHRCVHPDSRQKLSDITTLDLDIRPTSVRVESDGQLKIIWNSPDAHESVYDTKWLHKYGRGFMLETFGNKNAESMAKLPPVVLWDRTIIWNDVPEVSYNEFMNSESGLMHWLGMIHKYGVALIRGAPTTKNEIINVVNRFAYVKSTIWGQTFDVVCEPVQTDTSHLAFTGMHLAPHTDMNYREVSPGFQLLHCLKAMDHTETDYGGKSFFVDGFMVANWLRENNPAAFHILSSTPVEFHIKSHNMRYSKHWPIICVSKDGDLEEIHYNTRTMAPLQVPTHLVQPFYHGLKLFADKMAHPNSEWCFHLRPGDVVAFNNRRVLHGRTAFDATKVSRHLQGCYAEIDEIFTRYISMVYKQRNETL